MDNLHRGLLILIRGLPGSGKTTLAKKLAAQHDMIHFETDQFFEDNSYDGTYVHDRAKWSTYNKACFMATDAAMSDGKNVVVSNCFCSKASMTNYLTAAEKHNYQVLVLVADGKYKSVRGLPDEAFEQIASRWED